LNVKLMVGTLLISRTGMPEASLPVSGFKLCTDLEVEMQVKDVMSEKVEYLEPGTTIMEAAQHMKELGCGFLPVGDKKDQKLQGVITDRDIVVRGVAEGLDPKKTPISKVETEKVLYCFADDDVEKAARSMQDQRVYRLIVLNTQKDKQLCGIVTLGDIMRNGATEVAGEAARSIVEKVA